MEILFLQAKQNLRNEFTKTRKNHKTRLLAIDSEMAVQHA